MVRTTADPVRVAVTWSGAAVCVWAHAACSCSTWAALVNVTGASGAVVARGVGGRGPARLEERYKGFEVMLRALPLIGAKVPEVRWVVVGDGALRAELGASAAALGVADPQAAARAALRCPERNVLAKNCAAPALGLLQDFSMIAAEAKERRGKEFQGRR